MQVLNRERYNASGIMPLSILLKTTNATRIATYIKDGYSQFHFRRKTAFTLRIAWLHRKVMVPFSDFRPFPLLFLLLLY